MKNQEFRKDSNNRYIALTGEVAPGLPNVFVGFAGDTPAEVKETVIPAGRMPTEIVTDVPDEWKVAFRPHGFTFEDEEEAVPDTPVLTGIEAEIDYMKKRIELEALTRQLAGAEPVATAYTGSFDISFWNFTLLASVGVFMFLMLIKFVT